MRDERDDYYDFRLAIGSETGVKKVESMSEEIYTKKEFAERIGISVRTLERFIEQGKVLPVKIGSLVRFREHHITDFLNECDLSLKGKKKGLN